MQECVGQITASDGFRVFCRKWRRGTAVDRILFCIHGLGGHSEEFRILGMDLADISDVYAVDLRGFGQSVEDPLPRGDISDFNRHLEDIGDAILSSKTESNCKRVILLGHSLGACYAIWYAVRHQETINGLILTAPAVAPNISILNELDLLSYVAPRSMRGISRRDPMSLTISRESAYIDGDPLSAKRFSRFYLNKVRRTLISHAFRYASQVRIPTLILQGEADDVCSPRGAIRLYETIRAEDKHIKLVPEADHWLFHAIFYDSTPEPENKRDRILSIIKDWARDH